MQATMAKFSLHVGNIKFKTQNEECISIRVILHILNMHFSNIMCNKYLLLIMGKFGNKM